MSASPLRAARRSSIPSARPRARWPRNTRSPAPRRGTRCRRARPIRAAPSGAAGRERRACESAAPPRRGRWLRLPRPRRRPSTACARLATRCRTRTRSRGAGRTPRRRASAPPSAARSACRTACLRRPARALARIGRRACGRSPGRTACRCARAERRRGTARALQARAVRSASAALMPFVSVRGSAMPSATRTTT